MERIHPQTVLPYIFQEHINRYIFASTLTKGKTVLDVACGTGYGTIFLAKSGAKDVIGIDVSKFAIEECKSNVKYEETSQNLHLLVSDASYISIANNSVDVVVSFETIEHLTNYKNFLSEVKRILTRDGLFIVSTPCKEIFSPYTNRPLNPFHKQEFTIYEFMVVLSSHFKIIRLYGQKFSLLSNFFSLIPFGPKVSELLSKNRLYQGVMRRLAGKAYFRGKYRVRPLTLPVKRFLLPSYVVALCKKLDK